MSNNDYKLIKLAAGYIADKMYKRHGVPLSVYLFGSRSNGTSRFGSDYDFCIFLDRSPSKLEASKCDDLEHELRQLFSEMFTIFCFVKQDGCCLPPNFAIKHIIDKKQ